MAYIRPSVGGERLEKRKKKKKMIHGGLILKCVARARACVCVCVCDVPRARLTFTRKNSITSTSPPPSTSCKSSPSSRPDEAASYSTGTNASTSSSSSSDTITRASRVKRWLTCCTAWQPWRRTWGWTAAWTHSWPHSWRTWPRGRRTIPTAPVRILTFFTNFNSSVVLLLTPRRRHCINHVYTPQQRPYRLPQS